MHPAPNPVRWEVVYVELKGIHQQHCVPANDIRPHKLAEDCACAPLEDQVAPDCYMHYAWDRRERYLELGHKMH